MKTKFTHKPYVPVEVSVRGKCVRLKDDHNKFYPLVRIIANNTVYTDGKNTTNLPTKPLLDAEYLFKVKMEKSITYGPIENGDYVTVGDYGRSTQQ